MHKVGHFLLQMWHPMTCSAYKHRFFLSFPFHFSTDSNFFTNMVTSWSPSFLEYLHVNLLSLTPKSKPRDHLRGYVHVHLWGINKYALKNIPHKYNYRVIAAIQEASCMRLMERDTLGSLSFERQPLRNHETQRHGLTTVPCQISIESYSVVILGPLHEGYP